MIRKNYEPVISVLVIMNVVLFLVNSGMERKIIPLLEKSICGGNLAVCRQADDSIFSKREIIGLAKKLPELAHDIKVNLPSISYAFTKNDSNSFDKYELSFSVDGSYENIRKFIYRIETYPKFMRIDSLTLNRAGQAGSIGIGLKVSTYASGRDRIL